MESSQWGKEMRELNLGVHQLGPGGYRVAEPIWDKEDPVTKELTTNPKTRALELVLVRNTPPRN